MIHCSLDFYSTVIRCCKVDSFTNWTELIHCESWKQVVSFHPRWCTATVLNIRTPLKTLVPGGEWRCGDMCCWCSITYWKPARIAYIGNYLFPQSFTPDLPPGSGSDGYELHMASMQFTRMWKAFVNSRCCVCSWFLAPDSWIRNPGIGFHIIKSAGKVIGWILQKESQATWSGHVKITTYLRTCTIKFGFIHFSITWFSRLYTSIQARFAFTWNSSILLSWTFSSNYYLIFSRVHLSTGMTFYATAVFGGFPNSLVKSQFSFCFRKIWCHQSLEHL